MGTLNAVYVRVSTPEMAATLLAINAEAYTEPDSEFYAIKTSEFDPDESVLAGLSLALDTDVLWVGFQSVVDAFQFHHWRSGRYLRALVFGCHDEERVWERADGDPEAWERNAMFGEKDLVYYLEEADEIDGRELNRIWRECEIVPGRIWPNLDARATAGAVAEFYRLPGWS
jgi:hypothetical protein